jgi:nitrite reductase/ring-hydroxylating ferredoxin subunit
MLTREQSELVTRTGPTTPMGNLLRQYWIPILLAEELPENECPPVRVKLLCERLVAWRDSRGRYALIDEFCAHRGVSLWFGRNEENGLRCPYHGWKYDHSGQCVDVPSEPPESGFCKRIKLKSYPLVAGASRSHRNGNQAVAAAGGKNAGPGAAIQRPRPLRRPATKGSASSHDSAAACPCQEN